MFTVRFVVFNGLFASSWTLLAVDSPARVSDSRAPGHLLLSCLGESIPTPTPEMVILCIFSSWREQRRPVDCSFVVSLRCYHWVSRRNDILQIFAGSWPVQAMIGTQFTVFPPRVSSTLCRATRIKRKRGLLLFMGSSRMISCFEGFAAPCTVRRPTRGFSPLTLVH